MCHSMSDLEDAVSLLVFLLFTPLRGRVLPHQAYKVSYVLLVLVVVVVPGQIF